MNISDSERFAAFLNKSGFKQADKKESAGLIIINTCGVRQMAEDRVYGLVNEIRSSCNLTTKIIITGCLSRREDVKKRLVGKVDWFLPVGDVFLLPKLLQGEKYQEKFSLDKYRLDKGEKYLLLKPKYESSYSAVVPIGNGCNNFCSYCVVPYARGREVYRPFQDIVKEIKELVAKGYKEITLVAQNVNSYKDGKKRFPELLQEIIKIDGDFWIRFFSSHPKDMSDELIKVIASSEKICQHLHLALQSGDDKILELMNRKYSAKNFEELVKKTRTARAGIAITTDVIVGFPSETKKQFNNSAKLFKKIAFDMAYLAQYSPRPGTLSALSMKDDVSKEEKKRRFEVLNSILKESAAKANQGYIGKEVKVLIDGKNKRNKYYGKSSSFKTVLINSSKALDIGSFVKVKIEKVLPFALEGTVFLNKAKVVVILGPTASGKTSLGVQLAREYQGEIVGADSRQVYQSMDIGTGKDLAEYGKGKDSIKYHLIDVAQPTENFDLAKYQQLAFAAIDDILRRDKLAIIVGGSGLYLQAVIDNYELEGEESNRDYRDKLEKLGAPKLFAKLLKLKPEFANKLNNSDKNNARRLARYLEIAEQGAFNNKKSEARYDFLILGLDFPNEVLRERVSYRLLSRFEEGMIAEVQTLREKGLSDDRLESFGLEYRYISRHLRGELSYNEMVKQLEVASYRFAKRQKTWFKRWQKQGVKINWLKNIDEAKKLIDKFLA